jgi:hypothetical protein
MVSKIKSNLLTSIFYLKIIINTLLWVGKIGSFGVSSCVGWCGGANPKCANVGWLKLFFKMCGEKIFKTLRWLECWQTGLVCVKLQRIVNRVKVVRKFVWKSKVGRFGVRPLVVLSSFRLAYNGHGLAMWRYLKKVRPNRSRIELLMMKITTKAQ